LLVVATLVAGAHGCSPDSGNTASLNTDTDDVTGDAGAGPGGGWTIGQQVDLDGDGKPDGVAVDSDGDGYADGVDTNGDGKADQPLPSDKPAAPVNNTVCDTSLDDADFDGFTIAAGDCDDCSPQINPGAFDFPGNDFDEDCDGVKATADAAECDLGLAINSTDPFDAAKAIGLCNRTTMDSAAWGVISARFTTADGSGTLANAMMTGLLPRFGAAIPPQGSTLLALSTGAARAPDQSGFTQACDSYDGLLSTGAEPPAGYPKESTVCEEAAADDPFGGIIGGLFPDNTTIYDQAALEVKIRVPTNAKSFAFDSIFYTYEYPDYICSRYNDFFVVFKEPRPEFVEDGNILFDSNKDPIGVNTGLLSVCNASDQNPTAAKQFGCEQGTDLLRGTGFGPNEATCAQDPPGGTKAGVGGASTGWLKTTAPVSPGEVITLRFALWDTGDAILDSTALVDNFIWSIEEPEIATVPVVY
jgi:hypothetical protein